MPPLRDELHTNPDIASSILHSLQSPTTISSMLVVPIEPIVCVRYL